MVNFQLGTSHYFWSQGMHDFWSQGMTFLTDDCIAPAVMSVTAVHSVCVCLPPLRCRLPLLASSALVLQQRSISAVCHYAAQFLARYSPCMRTCFLRCCFRCVDCRSVVNHCCAIVDVHLLCFACVLPGCRCDFDRCIASYCCLACHVLHIDGAKMASSCR